jgi:uncharacterized membrane protein
MRQKGESPYWIVRLMRGHLRLWMAMVLAVIAYLVLPQDWRPITRMLIGWDFGAIFYLIAVTVMMARASVSDIRHHSEAQDEGALGLLLITVTAAMVSLGAIFAELATAERNGQGYGLYVGLAIATVVLSWMLIHTIFALHYAYEFYGDDDCFGGLKFPDDDNPDYWDFVYFSFVVGMTFQVSDVAVTNKLLRRMVVIHGAVAFFFTTAVVALTVNLAASIVQR